MVAYDSMSRAELIETIRSLEARLANAASGVGNPSDDFAKFPVLGMPEQLVAFWEQEIRRVFDSGEGRRIEFECPCHGGIRYFEARMVPDFGLKGAVISRRFDGAGMSWTLVREAEAVPLALVLNELVFNAQKHMTVGDGQRTIKVGLFSSPLGVEVCMTNHSDTFSSGATGDPEISWSPPWQ